MKLKEKIIKILAIIELLIILLPINLVQAAVINIGDIKYIRRGDRADYVLQYWSENAQKWVYIISSRTYYKDNNGVERIAYCVNKDLDGIGWIPGEVEGYDAEITKLYDNEKAWRVYKNGYPYKTPQELGVENEDDAYLATKQAGYMVIQGKSLEYVKNYYRGGLDPINNQNMEETTRRGNKVYNAIVKLVENAYSSKETSKKAKIEAVGNQEISKDKKYVIQKYHVEGSGINTKYNISTIDSLGIIIKDEKGVEKSEYNNNEYFYIYVPVEKITNDLDIKINAKVSIESYPIYYAKSKIANTQDYILTGVKYEEDEEIINLKIDSEKSSITIKKVDRETLKGIENTEIVIKDSNKKEIGKYITDGNGIIKIENLKQGKYYYQEVKSNPNYKIDNKEYELNLGYEENKEITFNNDRETCYLAIIKVDKDNPNITLGNVEFDIYSYEFNKVIGTYKTDVNGKFEIRNIRCGKYRIIEKSTNKYYDLAEDKEIEIMPHTINAINIENELKKGSIKIIKVDKEDNTKKLKDVKFQIMDSNKKVLEEIITDEEGIAKSKKYPIRDYKSLLIKEVETNQFYKLDESIHEIKLEENKEKELVIENELKKGKIKIVKIDKNNRAIENVKFNILDEDGTIIEELITDKDGIAISKELPINKKYFVKEVETNENYVLDEEEKEVSLKEDTTEEILIVNRLKKGKIRIKKVDETNENIYLSKVKFQVLDENKNLIEIVETDSNGIALTHDIDIGKYFIKEMSTNKEYVLDQNEYEVIVKGEMITDIAIKNKKIKGNIKIIKIADKYNMITKDEEGKGISGIKFKIYSEEGKEIEEIITNEEGIAISSELEYGNYIVKEVNPNKGYKDNEKEYKIFVEDNNKTYKLKIVNESKEPKIEVKKYGPEIAKRNEKILYEFDIKNVGNCEVSDFTWYDFLPYERGNISKIETGIFNEDIKYSIYYKTNKKHKDYILLLDNVSSKENLIIEIDKLIKLEEGERINEIKYDFGKVNSNFSNLEKRNKIEFILDNDLEDGNLIFNETILEGIVDGYKLSETDEKITKVEVPEEPKKLPRTGF